VPRGSDKTCVIWPVWGCGESNAASRSPPPDLMREQHGYVRQRHSPQRDRPRSRRPRSHAGTVLVTGPSPDTIAPSPGVTGCAAGGRALHPPSARGKAGPRVDAGRVRHEQFGRQRMIRIQ
jgi:hypothetical protein